MAKPVLEPTSYDIVPRLTVNLYRARRLHLFPVYFRMLRSVFVLPYCWRPFPHDEIYSNLKSPPIFRMLGVFCLKVGFKVLTMRQRMVSQFARTTVQRKHFRFLELPPEI